MYILSISVTLLIDAVIISDQWCLLLTCCSCCTGEWDIVWYCIWDVWWGFVSWLSYSNRKSKDWKSRYFSPLVLL